MTTETIKRTIVGLILAILNMIKVSTGFEIFVGDEFIYAIVDMAYVVYVAWKNNDFSPISARFTTIMRVAKKMAKSGDLSLIDALENTVKEWEDGNCK